MKMQKDWREDNWKAYDSKCYLPVEHVTNCKRKKIVARNNATRTSGINRGMETNSMVKAEWLTRLSPLSHTMAANVGH